MRFPDIKALVSLPYFKTGNDGMPVLRKSVLGHGIFDMHTHLGWHYLMTGAIDLWKKPRIRHLFPSDIAIDLSHYSSLDFTDRAATICRRELVRTAYDIRGYSSTHTIPNMLSEMDRFNVLRSAVLAIDFPFLSRNSMEYLEATNQARGRERGRFNIFVSIHPLQPGKEKVLKGYLQKGAKGIKLHTQMQMFRPTNRLAFPLYRLAAKYHLPILFHTGLAPIAPSWQRRFVVRNDFEAVFREFAGTTFIIGHAGGMNGYEWAALMAKRYPNVYVETSGQPLRGIEYLLNKVDENRILYGSDWPFYPMILPLAKTLLATERMRKKRSKLFWKNAEKLFPT